MDEAEEITIGDTWEGPPQRRSPAEESRANITERQLEPTGNKMATKGRQIGCHLKHMIQSSRTEADTQSYMQTSRETALQYLRHVGG